MNIAYVITETYSLSPYNGIRIQAETWADELKRKGHNIIKISPWDKHKWENYDIIHIFGPCEFLLNFTSTLYKRNKRIIFSPIIDTIQSITSYYWASLLGSKLLRLSSPNFRIRQSSPYIKCWLVRSQYEFGYVHHSYSIDKNNISIVPLSYRILECVSYPQKEQFCLHVSKLTDKRKNVVNLVKAAIKYKFNLVLAGSISSEKDFRPIRELIETNNNISYLGRVTDDELIDLYKRAKVFALPSINEGVGMVAVEAASYGCDIVITKIGGPKEYYKGMAYEVSPYNIDEIGKSICEAMECTSRQPLLMNHIKENYNLSFCVDKLLDVYKKVYND